MSGVVEVWTRPVPVRALHWTDERDLTDIAEMHPEFHVRNEFVVGPAHWSRAWLRSGVLEIRVPGPMLHSIVPRGHWLVVGDDGHLRAHTPDEFAEQYDSFDTGDLIARCKVSDHFNHYACALPVGHDGLHRNDWASPQEWGS